jgi:hemin uptake protein HemP
MTARHRPIRGEAPQRAADTRGDTALQSSALLDGARVRAIEHQGERYYPRLTRNGKLILCK